MAETLNDNPRRIVQIAVGSDTGATPSVVPFALAADGTAWQLKPYSYQDFIDVERWIRLPSLPTVEQWP